MTVEKPPEFRASCYSLQSYGLRLAVRVSPKASRESVGGLFSGVDGKVYLKVRVTAPAEDGKANKAVIKALSKQWEIPPSSISVVNGETSRQKIFDITCSSAVRDRLIEMINLIDDQKKDDV